MDTIKVKMIKTTTDGTTVAMASLVAAYFRDGEIQYLEIAGAETATRAIWAYMVSNNRKGSLYIGDKYVRIGEEQRFAKLVSTKISSGTRRIIIRSRGFDQLSRELIFGDSRGSYGIYGKDAIRRRASCFPFRDEWMDNIWSDMVKLGLAKKLEKISPYPDSPDVWWISEYNGSGEDGTEESSASWERMIKKYASMI